MLIEALIAILIFSIGILAAVGMQAWRSERHRGEA
jgi:Tfp pilus assembly protein PilV